MVSYRTVPRSYFQEVIDQMDRAGFELFAWVTMNSKRDHYHVDSFRYSQESRLFFRLRRKAVVVILILTEHFGAYEFGYERWDEDYHQVYWRGHIDYAYSRPKWLEAEYASCPANVFSWDFEPRCLDTLLWECFSEDVFRVCGNGDFEQTHTHTSELLRPEKVAEPFQTIGVLMNVPCVYRNFRELQVTSWAPHYTFPGQESNFWSQFPQGRMRSIISRPWGSDFGMHR